MKIKTWIKSLSKKYKILCAIIFAILFFDLIFATFFIIKNKYSSLKLYDFSNSAGNYLLALNKNARQSKIKNNDYAYFKFSENQKNLIKSVYEKEGTVSLVLRININPTTSQSILLDENNSLPFKFGFLNSDDFDSKDKLKKSFFLTGKKIVINCDEKNAPECFDISLSLKKNDLIEKYIPQGFFVYSSLRCFIKEACIAPSVVGFDSSTEIPFYGFSYNGGMIDFSNKSFDFTGASMVFSVQNTISSQMPEYEIKFSHNSEFVSTLDKPIFIDFNFNGEKISIKNVNAADKVIIPSAALKSPFGRVEVNSNEFCIKSITLNNVKEKNEQKNKVIVPIKTDPGLILNYKMENWRNSEYELFVWDRYSRILFFDTKNFDIQSKFFTRLAYFVEKQGFKGRLLTDSELEGKHGYNAHDYSAESLANFFNKAQDLNFELNAYEMLLKQILIKNELLKENSAGFLDANEGGIVSISRESPLWSRKNLFAHEGWHMIFFADEEFRNYVSAVYYTCDSNYRDFLIDYFRSQKSLGYDVNDDYLMHNEFMAYIMEKPTTLVAEDFVKKANWESVNKFTPILASYVRETQGKGFEDISNALNDFVFDKYGIIAGNIGLVYR